MRAATTTLVGVPKTNRGAAGGLFIQMGYFCSFADLCFLRQCFVEQHGPIQATNHTPARFEPNSVPVCSQQVALSTYGSTAKSRSFD